MRSQVQLMTVTWDFLPLQFAPSLSRAPLLAVPRPRGPSVRRAPRLPGPAHLQAAPVPQWQKACVRLQRSPHQEKDGKVMALHVLKRPVAPPPGTGDRAGTGSCLGLSQTEPSSFLTQTSCSQGRVLRPSPQGGPPQGCTPPWVSGLPG